MILGDASGLDIAAWPPAASLSLLVVLAIVAGVINAMAGGGSLLILPTLVALGLPPSVANGTIRVGVLVAAVSTSVTFHVQKVREYRVAARLAAPMIAGAIAGTWLATRLSDAVLRPLFGIALAAWAVILVVRPGRFLESPSEPKKPGPVAWIAAIAVGLYGGFLQAGVGFPLMALLILGLGHPPVQANAAKTLLVLAYTCIALPMFAYADQVAWTEGAALAVGSIVGGWLGSKWQVKGGARLVRWVVVMAVAVSGVMMLISS